jgi:hypothetical protein
MKLEDAVLLRLLRDVRRNLIYEFAPLPFTPPDSGVFVLE